MLTALIARIRAFLGRHQHQADLAVELQDHLEREVARNLDRGLSPAEARRLAHVAIGNLTVHAEDGRSAVRGIWIDHLAQDIKYAGRVLRRNPAFALAAVVSLGFGIGATTMAFSTIDALDFRPLPFHEPDRLVFLAEVAPPTDDFCAGCSSRVSAATANDWLAQVRSYDDIGVTEETSASWVHNDAIERLSVRATTPGFFRLLGAPVEFGRDFSLADTLAGARPVVIVTNGFWQQRLGGDPAAIGRPLPSSLDGGTDATLRGAIVIGVLPKRFRFDVSRARPVWIPLRLPATSRRTARQLTVVGRLRSGVTVAAASAEVHSLLARLAVEYPEPYRSWSARVEPLRDRLGWGAGGNRRLMFSITALVLLVAIINVAGLSSGRAVARRPEFAMRSAFGANSHRLLRQMLVEGTTIGIGGGVVGALLATWGTRFSSAWFGIDPGIATVNIRILIFALVLSLGVGIITALGPALRLSRIDLIADLRGKGLGATSTSATVASSALIIAQIALGLVLLTAAASLSMDFVRLRYTDLGFDPTDLYATSVSVARVAGQNAAIWRDVAEEVRGRVSSIPGVRSATLEYRSAVHPDIVRPAGGLTSSSMSPMLIAVSPTYFATWRLGLLRGRSFGAIDAAGAARVAIVNRTAADHFWPGQDPLGHQIFVGDSATAGELLTVVGVSEDAERGDLRERHWPMVYRPLAQATLWHTIGSLQIRIDEGVDRASVLALAQSRVRESMQRATEPFRSTEATLDEQWQARKLNAIALDFFATFGLLLAAMGVYASIGAAVTRRTREIGVRIALGAGAGATLRLIVRRGVALAIAGVVVGLVAAGAMARLLRSLVAGTDVLDPRIFLATAAVMVMTAGVAAWLPARRVLRVDPVDALRAD